MTDQEVFDLIRAWAVDAEIKLNSDPGTRMAILHNAILLALQEFMLKTLPDQIRVMHPHDAERMALECVPHLREWIEDMVEELHDEAGRGHSAPFDGCRDGHCGEFSGLLRGGRG